MKLCHLQWALAFLMLLAFKASAATLYVNLNNTSPTPPYTNWSIAATNIQDAIDASSDGDLILVTNGIYATGERVAYSVYSSMTNRVVIDKAITVQSVNGPSVTVIEGYQVPGTINGTNAIRCVWMTNGAILTGFTLTNGATHPWFPAPAPVMAILGGGVYCSGTNAVVSNCILIGNSAGDSGGGAKGGTLSNCKIEVNTSSYGGGADGSILNNCLVISNYASAGGGGVFDCTVRNCSIIDNSVGNGHGGGAYWSTLNNCTLAGNSADGAFAGTLNNCIVYYNIGTNYAHDNFSSIVLNNCCTTPLPDGAGNITNEPLFVDFAGGDFHLQSNSPCINSGNNAYATSATDLDGNPRIVGGTVDIGAYEYQTPVSQISYAWLQQYGLPITTNTDTADPDGDGMNNYQEWIAGTDPTNPLSLLEMLNPIPTNNPTGLVLSWQSVSNRTYFLQSGTNLGTQPAFSTIQSNIAGQIGTTSYTDTNAVGNGPLFYRVGVQ